MPPCFGQRPAPLDPLTLDRATVRELVADLARRLEQVDVFGGRCRTCGDAEARAFLARMRNLLDTMEPGTP